MAKNRIPEEKNTVHIMIRMYCNSNHGSDYLCPDCLALLNYAYRRLEKCPQHLNKPTCSKCAIHCYSTDMRIKMKQVMRFSGPRMLFRHPVMAIRHLLREIRK